MSTLGELGLGAAEALAHTECPYGYSVSGSGEPPAVTHMHYNWKIKDDFIAKCYEVADAMKFGVSTVPMLRISYEDDEV